MKNYKIALLYLATGLVFVVGGAYVSSKLENNIPNSSNPRPQVSCPPDTLSYNTVNNIPGQIVNLISTQTPMSAQDGNFVHSQVVVTKDETSDSKVACGYLYIQAGTTDAGPLRAWENPYINPNGFGGHIDKRSAFSINDGQYSSTYIFPLDKIQYWSTRDNKTILTADWSQLFNVSPSVNFQIGLNTQDPTGFVSKISIAYKCWNPKTGEENTGCKLTVN